MARALRWLAWGYPACVVALLLAFRFVGENEWLVEVLLYMPRQPLLLPLLLTVPGLWYFGPRWLLVLQVATALVVVFPLMGLELSPLRDVREVGYAPAATIRLVTWNMFYGHGREPLHDELTRLDADVLLAQASNTRVLNAVRAALPDYKIREDRGFLIASRFPISDVYLPPLLATGGQDDPERRPEFVRYTLSTPIGTIDVFNTHPYSPRQGFSRLLREPGEAIAHFEENIDERWSQVRALSEAVRAAHNPVLIGGDFNLPVQSRIYREYLGDLDDAFARVGNGFGYTFPTSPFAWMRIDRLLAGPELRFLRVGVIGGKASDHRPVWAQIERN
jgi:endonuclease/exonuclease/phosphatase family metal-dependent hydrolase